MRKLVSDEEGRLKMLCVFWTEATVHHLRYGYHHLNTSFNF